MFRSCISVLELILLFTFSIETQRFTSYAKYVLVVSASYLFNTFCLVCIKFGTKYFENERKKYLSIALGCFLLLSLNFYFIIDEKHLFIPSLQGFIGLVPYLHPNVWNMFATICFNQCALLQIYTLVRLQFKHKHFHHFVLLYSWFLPIPQWYNTIQDPLILICYFNIKGVVLLYYLYLLYQQYPEIGTVVKGEHECIICCDTKPDRWIQLTCTHTYHEKCISTWFDKQTTCPLCRSIHKPSKKITGSLNPVFV